MIAENLRKSEQRFVLVIEGMNDGIWDWEDMTKDEEYWSPQFKKLLGYEEHEIKASYHEFQCRLHPDDVDKIAVVNLDGYAELTDWLRNRR